MVAGSRARRAAATRRRARALEPGPGGGRRRRRGGRDARCCRRARGDAGGDRERGGFEHGRNRPCPRIWLQKPRARRRRARWERCLAARRVRRDPDGFRCVRAAFDVQGAARGLADVMRGSDGDGALTAAAAVAAATRMPAGAARVAEDEDLLSALCAVAAGGTSEERFERFGDEENAGTETAAAAHAADALANLAAHASSAKILAASPTASSAWLEAVTRRVRVAPTRDARAASVGAARLRRGGRFIFQNTDARVVAALVAAIAERLSDPREVLSTRVGAAGCASALALARVVAETPGESAFVDALVAALRFVGEASASGVGVGVGAARGGIRPRLARSSGSWRVSPRPRRKPCARVPGTQTGVSCGRASPRTWRAPLRKPPGVGAAAAPIRRRRRLSRRRSRFWLAERGGRPLATNGENAGETTARKHRAVVSPRRWRRRRARWSPPWSPGPPRLNTHTYADPRMTRRLRRLPGLPEIPRAKRVSSRTNRERKARNRERKGRKGRKGRVFANHPRARR